MPNPFGKLLERAPPSSTFGLKTLIDPGDSVALVDIVFIHGLTGRWDETWTCTEGGTSVFWPKDLLPGDIGNARIFSFGYDADAVNLRHRVSNETVSHHADSLLLKLERERRTNARKTRRIVFVAHSLGGLVVEKALCLSQHKAEAHLRQIAESTMGMVFFGTPHLGADLAVWAKVGADLANLLRKNNSSIVGVLEPSSEMLADIRDGLGELFRRRYESRDSLFIACFWEALPVTGVGEIVSRQSAIWPGHYKTAIHADHMNMTKFVSVEEEGYKDFLGELQRWLEERNLVAVTPDHVLNNPQHPHSISRIQQSVAPPTTDVANQDYRRLLNTVLDQPVDQDVIPRNLRYILSGSPSRTHRGSGDSRQDFDRELDSSDHIGSYLNPRRWKLDDANLVNISDSSNNGEAGESRWDNEFRVELVAQTFTKDTKIFKGEQISSLFIFRNPGPLHWPADFQIDSSSNDFSSCKVRKTKSGKVRAGEEIGIFLLVGQPVHAGPASFQLRLNTIDIVPFGPQFSRSFKVVETIHKAYLLPDAIENVIESRFEVDSAQSCSAMACFLSGWTNDCFVSEAFLIRCRQTGSSILDHTRPDQVKNITCVGLSFQSVGTIGLRWQLIGKTYYQHTIFYVIPGNPFFEVVLTSNIYEFARSSIKNRFFSVAP